MDKYLSIEETVDLLNFYGLKLPSEYKDKSLEEFQEAFDKGLSACPAYSGLADFGLEKTLPLYFVDEKHLVRI